MGGDDVSPEDGAFPTRRRPSARGVARPSSSSSSSSPDGRLLPLRWEEDLDRPHPLTAISRERREAEIALVSSLAEGDDALSDLWSLWFSERGPEAAAELLQAEELAGLGPDGWDEAERRLREMIDEHGVHWSEPVNRLATLLYQRGRLPESRALCELVLAVKPWHFGALSGVVLVCAGMGDVSAARLWADRRLPPVQPVGDNARRAEWVRRATGEAERSLRRAEEAVKEGFGVLDKYEDDARREAKPKDRQFGFDVEDLEPREIDVRPGFDPQDEEDAWQ